MLGYIGIKNQKKMFMNIIILISLSLQRTLALPISLDFSDLAQAYEGIGALSGGGGVTRLLIDYPQDIQQDIYDILFTPKKGASLQIIKVEIGGMTQSTEGTEDSHMRDRNDLNCSRGYEWNVLMEAKKRNPDIKTFGLSWGVPGYIGNGNYYSQDNIDYHTNWIYCSNEEWSIPIDFLGIWNERTPDPTWTKQLRSALDVAGYDTTRIVYADVGWEVVNQLQSDPELLNSIDIIGAHYPNQPPSNIASLNKSYWASEMWNLGTVNDWNGATALANDLSQQARWGMSSSIVWCLIFSWFAPLPFSRPTNTNAGLGHALLVAAEPWSKNYIISPTVHIIAHHTQFAEPGWHYLNNSGMGTLTNGGSYVTRVNTHTPSSILEFSITIDAMGVSNTQSVDFVINITNLNKVLPTQLYVWSTTQLVPFQQQANVIVNIDGTFTIQIPADSMVSVTTTTGQSAPTPKTPVPPSAPFPFPYSDSFEGYAIQSYAKYFSDEGGVFVVDEIPQEYLKGIDINIASGQAYHNVVDVIPIAWETNPLPYTLIGNFNGGPSQSAWTDYVVTVSAALDSTSLPPQGLSLRATQNTCGTTSSAWILRGSLASIGQLESSSNPGLCISISGQDDPSYPSPEIIITNCSSLKSFWYLKPETSQLVNNVTSACIDELSSSKAPDDDLIAYTCKAPNDPSGIINQQWSTQPSPLGGGLVEIVSNNSGLCITAANPIDPSTSSAYVMVASRINTYIRNGAPVNGYALYLFASTNSTVNGTWKLNFGNKNLANGTTTMPIVAGTFYQLGVSVKGSLISATINGVQVTSVQDESSSFGMAAFGSSWTKSWFDTFSVANITSE